MTTWADVRKEYASKEYDEVSALWNRGLASSDDLLNAWNKFLGIRSLPDDDIAVRLAASALTKLETAHELKKTAKHAYYEPCYGEIKEYLEWLYVQRVMSYRAKQDCECTPITTCAYCAARAQLAHPGDFPMEV